MSYEILEKEIKGLPEAYLSEISQFVMYLKLKAHFADYDEFNEETKAAIREVEEMKKNPSIGKSYTDVDAMMKELLA